jgi:hypothetical protein
MVVGFDSAGGDTVTSHLDAVGGAGACAGALTLTITAAVTEPAAFVAVSVYVVVANGVTDLLESPVTGPTPLSIVSDVSPETVHASVAEAPWMMPEGEAVNDEMTGLDNGGAVTLTKAELVALGSAVLVATTWYSPGVSGAV